MENGQDAAILKHFYTSTAPGVEAARGWGVEAWSDADWDSKIERIMRTYQRKQKKAAKAGDAADWREMMYNAFVSERGLDPRAAFQAPLPARALFAELEQQAQSAAEPAPAPSAAAAARSGSTVSQRIAERQREAREAEAREAREAQQRREELEMQRLQKELKVAERRRKLREEEARERAARDAERDAERQKALMQREVSASYARQRAEEEAESHARWQEQAGDEPGAAGEPQPDSRVDVHEIAAATKASRAAFQRKEAEVQAQAEAEARALASAPSDSRVAEIIAARKREAAAAAADEERQIRQAQKEKERARLAKELRWLETQRAAAEEKEAGSDVPSAELEQLRRRLQEEKAALAALAAEDNDQPAAQIELDDADELAAITAEQREREVRAVAEATQAGRSRAQDQEEELAAAALEEEEARRRANDGISAEGVRVAELVASKKKQAIAAVRAAEEARLRAAEARSRAMVENELRRLEERLRQRAEGGGEEGEEDEELAELRALIKAEQGKLEVLEAEAAASKERLEAEAAGWSVEEVARRAELEGWDFSVLSDKLAQQAPAAGVDLAADAQAVLAQQREALAALQAAEDQDREKLRANQQAEQRAALAEWQLRESQLLAACGDCAQQALIAQLMAELRERYIDSQGRVVDLMMGASALESQCFALRANWEDAEERVRRGADELTQSHNDARQTQMRHDLAIARTREELRASVEERDRFAAMLEAKNAEVRRLEQHGETLQNLLLKSTAESEELKTLLEALRAAELSGVQVDVKTEEKLLEDGGIPHVSYKFDVRLGKFRIHKFSQRYSAARQCYETLEERGVLSHMHPPLAFPPKHLLRDMNDRTNIAQRGEELRYYYERLLGDPKLLTDPLVHELLGIEAEQVDMATQSSKMCAPDSSVAATSVPFSEQRWCVQVAQGVGQRGQDPPGVRELALASNAVRHAGERVGGRRTGRDTFAPDQRDAARLWRGDTGHTESQPCRGNARGGRDADALAVAARRGRPADRDIGADARACGGGWQAAAAG